MLDDSLITPLWDGLRKFEIYRNLVLFTADKLDRDVWTSWSEMSTKRVVVEQSVLMADRRT